MNEFYYGCYIIWRNIGNPFYDPMLPTSFDPWTGREKAIPLPGGNDSSDGYARVLFVGTTGAGKTTIVRQQFFIRSERADCSLRKDGGRTIKRLVAKRVKAGYWRKEGFEMKKAGSPDATDLLKKF